MKQKIIFIITTMCLVYLLPHGGYAQRKLITSGQNSTSFKRQSSNKTSIVEYIEKKSKTGTVKIFQFDADVLRDSIFFLDVFQDTSLRVVKDEIDKRNEGDFSLYTHIQGPGSKEGSLVLVYENGEISGNLNYRFKNYAIHPLGKGRFALYEIDFKQFPQEDAPSNFHNDKNSKGDTNSGSTNQKSLADGALCAIRIIVAFTPNAENKIKTLLGYATMNQFINQAIAETNQAYINSHVNFRVELATAKRVAYTESGNYDTDLGRFSTPGDGYMDEVHTYRNLYSADLCVLIFNNSDYCGLASAIQANASTAFCVVHYDCALGYYSFAHEMGHLYGCRHNPETDPTAAPFAYGHGYVYGPAHWRTIMAYSLSGETRLQYFSTPNVLYGGIAMGNAGVSYNTRVLNETAGTVGRFRGPFSTLTLTSSGSIINDEAGDAASTTAVILKPGFQILNNSVFHAYIKTCTDLAGTASRSDYVVNDISKEEDTRFAKTSINIYPNPTSGVVEITGARSAVENTQIIINDELGRVVYKTNNRSGNTIKLNLDHLLNGVYYININAPNKPGISKKLIIIK